MNYTGGRQNQSGKWTKAPRGFTICSACNGSGHGGSYGPYNGCQECKGTGLKVKRARSFLDGVNPPPGCPLSCHDSNHNGDDHPGRSCGNPKCWKHGPDAPSPKWMSPRDPRCTCEFGETK